MFRSIAAALAAALVLTGSLEGQEPYYQSDFPAEEFQARWAQLFDAIGDDAVAVIQGIPETDGFIYPRQYNTFYYLSGVEALQGYMLLDGRTRTTTLYLPARDEHLAEAEGLELAANDVEFIRRRIGVDHAEPLEAMQDPDWPIGPFPGRVPSTTIYTELMPAEGAKQTRGRLLAADRSRALDHWDGGVSRQRRFVELLRARHPRAEVQNLSPILDDMRSIKSPREVTVLRRACQLAGLGLMEAMRSTEPGAYEYQLDAAARYVFLVHGARLEAYRSITASGMENIHQLHYFRNTDQLRDGELVLMDYAPDYGHYVCDIGRVWPVNGEYDDQQRELLQFVLEYHKAVLSRIRAGLRPDEIMEEAAEAMEEVFARTTFSKPIYEAGARRLVETGGGVFSHTVGLAVHDVGTYRGAPLKPGQVFSVDPQLRIPEERIYLRYEDTVVVTEDGVENFTDFIPMELHEMEALVREEGVVQRVPPVSLEDLGGGARR